MSASNPARSEWPLVLGNAADASARELFDFLVSILAVSTLGATAFQMGLLNAAETIGVTLFGIPLGVVADRNSPRTLLSIAAAIRITVVAAFAGLLLANAISFTAVLVIAVIFGLGGVVVETTQMAAVPRITTRERVSKLVGHLTAADTGVTIIMPAIAGFVVGAAGYLPLTIVALGLLAVSLLASVRLRVPRSNHKRAASDHTTSPPDQGRTFRRDARTGFSVLRHQPTLRRLTISTSLANLGLAIMSSVEVIYFLRVLDVSEATLGVVFALGAAGGFVGSLIAPRIQSSVWQRYMVLAGFSAQVCLAALLIVLQTLPASLVVPLLAVQFATWGFVVVLSNVVQAGWSAHLIPHEAMGRTLATRRTLTYGIVPAGSLLGGAVGQLLGINWALAAWLVLTSVATAVVVQTAHAEIADLGP